MFFRFLSYNAFIVISKLVSSFIISKVSAIFLGPSGYALVGNFRNIFQIFLGVSASGFESGTIKHISENRNNTTYFSTIVSSIIVFSLGLSVILGFFILIFAESLSIIILKSTTYAFIFRYAAFLLPIVALNSIVLYIINGLQKIKTYTKLVILTSLVNALLAAVLVYYFDLEGALLSSIIASAIVLVVSFTIRDVRLIFKETIFHIKKVSVTIIKSMSVYVAMATYSTILISISYFLIRNEIITSFNENIAGYWEAMNKISMFYMVFFTSIFMLYLLPKLSENSTLIGYKTIMQQYFKMLIPVCVCGFVFLFFIRTLVIKIFLTDAFQTIEQYFVLQFLGDFIKIVGFSIACQFHAKKMVTIYFVSDFIIYVSFYFLSVMLLEQFELKGVFYAHIFSCSLYLLVVSLFILVRNKNYVSSNE